VVADVFVQGCTIVHGNHAQLLLVVANDSGASVRIAGTDRWLC
jgi:hypothetical protein